MSDELTITDQEREACKALFALADELDDHQKKLDKIKLGFSTTGAAGGIMTFAGLALTPFTAGISLSFVIAGGVIGGLSAVGGITSLIADKILNSKTTKKATQTVQVLAEKVESVKSKLPQQLAALDKNELNLLMIQLKDIKIGKEIMDFFEEKLGEFGIEPRQNAPKLLELDEQKNVTSIRVQKIWKLAKELHKWTKAKYALLSLGPGAGAVVTVTNAGKAVSTAADAGIDAAKAAGKTLSGLKMVGIATAGVGLAFDIGGIVYYSMKVHKKKPCEIAENIREVARCFVQDSQIRSTDSSNNGDSEL